MSFISLLSAIFGAPAAINALLARVDALENALADMKKSQLISSIVQTQKDTEAAQSDADFEKASADNASNLRSL